MMYTGPFRALEWCARCGGSLKNKPHQCLSTHSSMATSKTDKNKKLSLTSSSAFPRGISSPDEEAFAFSPPPPGVDSKQVLESSRAAILLQDDDRLEDTKWGNWSAPNSSSLSSYMAVPSGRSPSESSPLTAVTIATSSPPDKNIWNVSVLSDYQLFKPSSAPGFESSSSANFPLIKPISFIDDSNYSWSEMDSTTPSTSLFYQVSLSAKRKTIQRSGSVGSKHETSKAAVAFPSKFSEAKEYIGTGIADLLSPVKPANASTSLAGTRSSSVSASERGDKVVARGGGSSSGAIWSSEDDEYDMASAIGTTRKLFVGRIPKDATEDSVLAFFRQFGHVEAADVNADRGCCFITFDEASIVDQILEGKNVKYLDFEGNEVCARRYVVIEKDKIFVRGLATGTSKEEMFKYFKQFGRIVNITLHQNKNGAHPFAFVRFARQKSVNQIMARNDHVICGKTVHCLRAHRQDADSTNTRPKTDEELLSNSS